MYSESLKPVLVLCFLIALKNFTNKDINVPFFYYYYWFNRFSDGAVIVRQRRISTFY